MESSEKRSVTVVADDSLRSDSSSQRARSPDRTFEEPKPHRVHMHHSVDLDAYFKGPRDLYKHSKWPFFLRLHGSVLPKMILPLFIVAGWATTITCISKLVVDLGINSGLLTVLGFAVALALSFRSSTAYERYSEGRRYWAQLILESRNFSRLIWINTPERHDEPDTGKADLLAKLTALNLINAFAVALKHRLRFEPAIEYPDLQPLVSHLQTFAGAADQSKLRLHMETPWHEAAKYLGVSFALSNPRKILKRSKDNLGNLPLEILSYLASYIETLVRQGLLSSTAYQGNALGSISTLASILTGTERITNTPLPIAYSISISQITWVYVMALPFQLYKNLGWITIPGTVIAAYIILGLAAIGREIENPFGDDVNDLPLDAYCRELAADIDVLISMPPPKPEDFVTVAGNKLLYPLSLSGYDEWQHKSVEEIRGALRAKAVSGVALKTGLPTENGEMRV